MSPGLPRSLLQRRSPRGRRRPLKIIDPPIISCYTLVMPDTLQTLQEEIVSCTACPRLVKWCTQVAQEKVARFKEQTYWGKPVPSFGDVNATTALIGLAPAAHGANRTGRPFTGDRS